MTGFKVLKIFGRGVIAYSIFALGAAVLIAMVGFILGSREFFLERNHICFILIGIMMCLWALYILLILTYAIFPRKADIMFEMFSSLIPGRITANNSSQKPSFKVSESTVKTYCDLAVEALTMAQLDQLDENLIKAEKHLQDGIDYIKKLRSML